MLEKKQMFCVSLQDMYALAGHSEEVCGEKPGSVCVLMCAWYKRHKGPETLEEFVERSLGACVC